MRLVGSLWCLGGPSYGDVAPVLMVMKRGSTTYAIKIWQQAFRLHFLYQIVAFCFQCIFWQCFWMIYVWFLVIFNNFRVFRCSLTKSVRCSTIASSMTWAAKSVTFVKVVSVSAFWGALGSHANLWHEQNIKPHNGVLNITNPTRFSLPYCGGIATRTCK